LWLPRVRRQRLAGGCGGGAGAAGGEDKADSGDVFLYSPLKVVIFVGLMCGMLVLMYFFYNILGECNLSSMLSVLLPWGGNRHWKLFGERAGALIKSLAGHWMNYLPIAIVVSEQMVACFELLPRVDHAPVAACKMPIGHSDTNE